MEVSLQEATVQFEAFASVDSLSFSFPLHEVPFVDICICIAVFSLPIQVAVLEGPFQLPLLLTVHFPTPLLQFNLKSATLDGTIISQVASKPTDDLP